MNELLHLPLSTGVYYLLYILYTLAVVVVATIIISENRSPVKTLAWILVLLLLPIVGVGLYLFFGQNYTKQRMISKRGLDRLHEQIDAPITPSAVEGITANNKQLIALAYKISNSLLYSGNSITTYTTGEAKFAALKQSLRSAQHFIHMEYYIFNNDGLGEEIKQILIERAEAGVKVRLLYDDVGSWGTKKSFFKEMRTHGIAVYPFQEITFPRLANRLNYRNHRKIVIVDGTVGYLGGMNIAQRYIRGVEWGGWRDTHLKIEGAAVQGLQKAFSVDWNFSGHGLLSQPIYYPPQPQGQEGVSMQIVTGGPIGTQGGVLMPILKAVSQARQRIYIQTPYFLPSETLLTALQMAAFAGVDVRIITPQHSDSYLVQHAVCSYITQLLTHDIKVYHYTAGFIHAKSMLVDDDLTIVGSANMDFRSFEHNFEINALIYNKVYNAQALAIYRADEAQSVQLRLDEWHKRPIHKRVVESVVRLFSPLL